MAQPVSQHNFFFFSSLSTNSCLNTSEAKEFTSLHGQQRTFYTLDKAIRPWDSSCHWMCTTASQLNTSGDWSDRLLQKGFKPLGPPGSGFVSPLPSFPTCIIIGRSDRFSPGSWRHSEHNFRQKPDTSSSSKLGLASCSNTLIKETCDGEKQRQERSSTLWEGEQIKESSDSEFLSKLLMWIVGFRREGIWARSNRRAFLRSPCHGLGWLILTQPWFCGVFWRSHRGVDLV